MLGIEILSFPLLAHKPHLNQQDVRLQLKSYCETYFFSHSQVRLPVKICFNTLVFAVKQKIFNCQMCSAELGETIKKIKMGYLFCSVVGWRHVQGAPVFCWDRLQKIPLALHRNKQVYIIVAWMDLLCFDTLQTPRFAGVMFNTSPDAICISVFFNITCTKQAANLAGNDLY